MNPNELKITNFPNSSFQLHIHDAPGGPTHIRTYDRDRIPMNNSDAAMGELYARNMGIGQPLPSNVDLYGMLKKINY